MAEAADAVVERLDLIVYVVRSAGKAGAALDQLLDRRGGLFNRIAVPIPDEAAAFAARFEHRDVGGKRIVARRVSERLGDDRRGADKVGGEIGAAQAPPAGRPAPDPRRAGQPGGAPPPPKFPRAVA